MGLFTFDAMRRLAIFTGGPTRSVARRIFDRLKLSARRCFVSVVVALFVVSMPKPLEARADAVPRSKCGDGRRCAWASGV